MRFALPICIIPFVLAAVPAARAPMGAATTRDWTPPKRIKMAPTWVQHGRAREHEPREPGLDLTLHGHVALNLDRCAIRTR